MPSNSTKYNTEYKRRYKAKLRAIVREFKSRPCEDCGIEYPHFVMDFDHGTNEKLFAIGSAVASASVSQARLVFEISKCDVVCANCHRLRHAANLSDEHAERSSTGTL